MQCFYPRTLFPIPQTPENCRQHREWGLQGGWNWGLFFLRLLLAVLTDQFLSCGASRYFTGHWGAPPVEGLKGSHCPWLRMEGLWEIGLYPFKVAQTAQLLQDEFQDCSEGAPSPTPPPTEKQVLYSSALGEGHPVELYHVNYTMVRLSPFFRRKLTLSFPFFSSANRPFQLFSWACQYDI